MPLGSSSSTAKCIGISARELLDGIGLYSDRNEYAHSQPPQLSDHLIPKAGGGYDIDWSAVRVECDNKKANLAGDLTTGKITQTQHDQFCAWIDRWYRISAPDPAKSGIMAEPYNKLLEQAVGKHDKSLKAAAQPLMPSEYSVGKWDDLF